MSRINVGKVAPIPKGVWSSTATYEKLNLVNKGGILYIAKVDNIPAGTPVTNTDYWMKATNSLSIGTITPVESISEANASIEDTNDGQVLNLDIPYGVISTEYIDDTAGEGDTNKIWSADKTQREINNHINKSASGSIVTLTDAMDAPVSDMVVAIEPVQDLHGYDYPWTGGAGKNLLPTQPTTVYNGVTFTLENDGGYTFSGTASGNAVLDIRRGSFSLPSGSYYFSVTGTNNAVFSIFSLSGDTTTVIKNGTGSFTLSETTSIFVRIYFASGTTASGKARLQIESGSSATAYEPYSNICPITGWDACKVASTGKNLLPKTIAQGTTANDVTFTVNNDGTIVANGTASANTTFAFVSRLNNNFGVYPAGTYTFSGLPSTIPSGVAMYYQVNDGDTYSYQALNASNPTRTMVVTDKLWMDSTNRNCYIYIPSGTVCSNLIFRPQIELGSTATTYEPYQGQQVTIDLGDIRYGGSLDVTSGVLTVTQYGFIADGVNYVATGSATASGKKYIGISLTSNNLPSSVNTITTNLDKYYCSHAKFIISASAIYYDSCYIASSGKSIYYYVSENEQDMTMTAFNQKLQTDPIQFVYLLAEPIIIQLTPTEVKTILNLNHIWADTGDILSLDYMTSNATSLVQYIENQDDKNVLTKSAEAGAIVHFYNSADAPLAGLRIGIEPVQDLHGYDAPWPAGGGKNLIEPKMPTSSRYGVTCTNNGDGSFKLNGTATATTTFRIDQSTYGGADNLKTYKAGQYTVSGLSGGIELSVMQNDTWTSVMNFTSDGTQTVSADTDNCFIFLRIPNGTAISNVTIKPQLELGSTATSWTPYSNISPITGWDTCKVTSTGKNLRGATNTSVTYSSGTLYWTVDSDGYASAVDPDYDSRSWSYANCQWFVHLKAGTYYAFVEVKYSGNQGTSFMIKKPDSTNYINITIPTNISTPTVYKSTFTVTENMRVGIYSKMWDGLQFRFCISTEELSTYEPYNGQTVTVDLGGTRYGGTIDVTTGVLTVDRAMVDLGTLNWRTESTITSGKIRFRDLTLINAFPTSSVDNKVGLICSSYSEISARENYRCNIGIAMNTEGHIYIYDPEYSSYSVENFKTAMSGVQLVYLLASPITIQVDPTNLRALANENLIWSDTGDILSLDYYTPTGKTTAEAIDAVKTDAVYDTTQTRGMITQSSETAMTASKNYVTGDLLIIGNQLLRAKSNIASGTTITIGTLGNTEVVDLATVIAEKSVNTHTHDNRYYTESEINTLFAGKDALKSASGSLLTLTDAADAPVADLTVAIEPVQSGEGDPSPTNVRAITGWDACKVAVAKQNLLPISSAYDTGTQSTLSRTYDNNIVTISGTVASANSTLYNQYITDIVKNKGTVTISSALISGTFDNIAMRVNVIKDGTVTNRWTFTGSSKSFSAEDDCLYQLLITTPSGTTIGASVNVKFSFQLELGSSATTYEPYQGQTVTIDLGGTTRYGGSLNVTTGELTVDRGIVYLKDLSWTLNATANIFNSSIADRRIGASSSFINGKNISNIYVIRTSASSSSGLSSVDYGFAFGSGSNASVNVSVYVKDIRATTVDEATALFTAENPYIVYELAEPQTIQLTPTEVQMLLGLNNVWADTGDVDIVYCTNTDNGKEIKRTLDTISHKIALLQSQIDEISQ